MKLHIQHVVFVITLFIIAGCTNKQTPITPSTTVNQASPQHVSGVVELMKVYNDTLTTTSFTANRAAFVTSTIHEDSIFSSLLTQDVGQITLSNVILKKMPGTSSSGTYYSDTVGVLPSATLNCIIGSNSPTGGFPLSNSNPYPVWNNLNALPDSVHTNTGVTITLPNISGYDRIVVYIHNYQNGSTVAKSVVAPSTSVSFSANDFSSFLTGAYKKCSINILMYKNTYQTINNKVYNFRSGYKITKGNVGWLNN